MMEVHGVLTHSIHSVIASKTVSNDHFSAFLLFCNAFLKKQIKSGWCVKKTYPGLYSRMHNESTINNSSSRKNKMEVEGCVCVSNFTLLLK